MGQVRHGWWHFCTNPGGSDAAAAVCMHMWRESCRAGKRCTACARYVSPGAVGCQPTRPNTTVCRKLTEIINETHENVKCE